MNGKLSIVLVLAAAAGCSYPRANPEPYQDSGRAPEGALVCARHNLEELGYFVRGGGSSSITGARTFDSAAGEPGSTGYVTATLLENEPPGERTLTVLAERYATGSDRVAPNPTPRPQPYDTIWARRGQRPSEVRRRVSPGPVAHHARRVIGRCTFRVETD